MKINLIDSLALSEEAIFCLSKKIASKIIVRASVRYCIQFLAEPFENE
jgi:hypothetical protein